MPLSDHNTKHITTLINAHEHFKLASKNNYPSYPELLCKHQQYIGIQMVVLYRPNVTIHKANKCPCKYTAQWQIETSKGF